MYSDREPGACQTAGQEHDSSGGAVRQQQTEQSEEEENERAIQIIKQFHLCSTHIIIEGLRSDKPSKRVAHEYVAHLSAF